MRTWHLQHSRGCIAPIHLCTCVHLKLRNFDQGFNLMLLGFERRNPIYVLQPSRCNRYHHLSCGPCRLPSPSNPVNHHRHHHNCHNFPHHLTNLTVLDCLCVFYPTSCEYCYPSGPSRWHRRNHLPYPQELHEECFANCSSSFLPRLLHQNYHDYCVR